MVLVWQQGHGSHTAQGIPATGAITMWGPVMVFAFLPTSQRELTPAS